MLPDFDALLGDYARYRTGYPREVYARITSAPLRRRRFRGSDAARL